MPSQLSRIVITGVGLTAPNGNNLSEFRQALLQNKSGIVHKYIRHMSRVAASYALLTRQNTSQEKHAAEEQR